MFRYISFVFALLAWLSLPAQAETLDWKDLRPLLVNQPGIEGQPAPVVPQEGPVVVTFFASWCPPCTAEFKHLNALKPAIADKNAKIVAINLFEDFFGSIDPIRMKRFLNRTKPAFPLLQGSQEIADAFGNITRIPTVVVFGESGRETWRFIHIENAKKTHATKEDILAALEITPVK